MTPAFAFANVTIRELPPVPVAMLSHVGHPAGIAASVERFIALRKAAGLRPPESATYNVYRIGPSDAAPERFRMDLCAGTNGRREGLEGLTLGEIPGGRRAVLRVTGPEALLEAAIPWLRRDWFVRSGETLGDFPAYCQRVAMPPQVRATAMVSDLFLPLRPR